MNRIIKETPVALLTGAVIGLFLNDPFYPILNQPLIKYRSFFLYHKRVPGDTPFVPKKFNGHKNP